MNATDVSGDSIKAWPLTLRFIDDTEIDFEIDQRVMKRLCSGAAVLAPFLRPSEFIVRYAHQLNWHWLVGDVIFPDHRQRVAVRVDSIKWIEDRAADSAPDVSPTPRTADMADVATAIIEAKSLEARP